MSIVVYHNDQLVSDSICLLGVERLRTRKIFPYCKKGETGYLGFVGSVSLAVACLHAYMTSGTAGFWDWLKNADPEGPHFRCIILPVGANHMWTGSIQEPLHRLELQTRVLGYETGVIRMKCALEEKLDAHTALESVIRASNIHDADLYVEGPVYSFDTIEMFEPSPEDKDDPVLMQFWDYEEAKYLKG